MPILKQESSFIFWLLLMLSFVSIECGAHTVAKDTAYFNIVFNIVEKDFVHGERIIAPYENELLLTQEMLEKKLGKQYVLLPIDKVNCERKFPTDSIFLKSKTFLTDFCAACRIKTYILFHVSWAYMSDGAYLVLQSERRTNLHSQPRGIIGTWWKIEVLMFNTNAKKFIYQKIRRYEQSPNRIPLPNAPGRGHKRFYAEVIDDLRYFR